MHQLWAKDPENLRNQPFNVNYDLNCKTGSKRHFYHDQHSNIIPITALIKGDCIGCIWTKRLNGYLVWIGS